MIATQAWGSGLPLGGVEGSAVAFQLPCAVLPKKDLALYVYVYTA
jgi:hypothetical protein